MRKFSLSVLLTLILSAGAYSQKGFFLTPIIENKCNVNAGHPYDVTTAQGYSINVRPLDFYNYFNWFDVGLYVGYRTKNFFFETGWSSDQANTATQISATCSYVDSIHFLNEITSSMGTVYNKYPFRVGVKLFGKDSMTVGRKIRWECFVYGGIDLMRRAGTGAVQGDGYDFVLNNALQQSVHFENISQLTTNRSALNTIGFMLKAYNKKGNNIFSLGVHYSQGHNHTLAYNDMKFTNYDGKVYYGLPLRSKASGLYINISKDIYPKNFFKKKKTGAESFKMK